MYLRTYIAVIGVLTPFTIEFQQILTQKPKKIEGIKNTIRNGKDA